jgi:hypothetical protein
MKAYEFPTTVTSDGKLAVPSELIDQLPSDREVRVIVLVTEPEAWLANADWSRLTAEQFLAGYDDADAIYDNM